MTTAKFRSDVENYEDVIRLAEGKPNGVALVQLILRVRELDGEVCGLRAEVERLKAAVKP